MPLVVLTSSGVSSAPLRTCILHPKNHFHVGRILRVPSDASSSSPLKKTRKPTRTRKAYSELPAVFTARDGSPLTPLAPWSGGLEGISIAADLAARAAAAVVEEPEVLEPIVKPKRTRTRKTTTEAATAAQDASPTVPLEDSAPTEETSTKPKAKRTRKPRAVKKEEDESEIDASQQSRSPLAAEILGNLARFPHCILLTRVGQFYESYFDQAAEVAKLLNIKLTSKSWGGKRVLMCGFPIMHLNKYLDILVKQNKRFVAICEEFTRNPSLGAKGGFDRRVSRVVTPGTLIDEPFLNAYENNYLVAVASPKDEPGNLPDGEPSSKLGLAWIDVSTGDFFTKGTTLEELRDELVRIGPKEVVLDRSLQSLEQHPIRQVISDESLFVSYIEIADSVDIESPSQDPSTQQPSDDLISKPEGLRTESLVQPLEASEFSAVQLLAAFMHAHLLEHMPTLISPNREVDSGRMQIDAHTLRALEIRESMREGGTAGTLLSVVKRTITTSGTRLLTRWLCSPSTSVNEINTRQSLVAFFKQRSHLRADLVQQLGNVEDTTRIIQKFLSGRGDASDLLAVCSTIGVWASITSRIQIEKEAELQRREVLGDDWTSLNMLLTGMCDLRSLADSINRALVQGDAAYASAGDVPSSGIREGTTDISDSDMDTLLSSSVNGNWTIRPEYSKHLSTLHTTLRELLSRRDKLERHFQATYDAPSLTLRSSPGQGMHIHIGRVRRDSAKLRSDPTFILTAESGSTCCFFNQEWSQLGTRILDVTTAIYIEEREAFEALRNQVKSQANDLRKNARILDELDVTLAFANLAEELNFCRPVLKEDTSYAVVDGRHPTVELGLLTAGRTFIPNSITFTQNEPLHIITGPNMAGKSTLLRQTALIAILAQTGSFVPADSAEIGIVDRVFSRIGAKDDLFRDRSTFMVEMLETAEILRRATPQSLVIMDEVGRGTTVDDGLAIAFATVHHLLSVNKCRALFATHFHEIADLLGYTDDHKGRGEFSGISFFCTGVDEMEDGYFSYSHRLTPGINRDSHGLKVAQLAGMPTPALSIATAAMAHLKAMKNGERGERQNLQAIGQMLASQHL